MAELLNRCKGLLCILVTQEPLFADFLQAKNKLNLNRFPLFPRRTQRSRGNEIEDRERRRGVMFISCQEDLIFIGLHFLRWQRSCVIAVYDSVDYGFASGSFILYKLFCESCLMDLRRA